MGITAIGVLSFRRWKWAIEVIYPVLMVLEMALIFGYHTRDLIDAETMSRTKLGKQSWIMVLWGIQVCFFRTDYKTSLYRPLVLSLALFIIISVHDGIFKATSKEISQLSSYIMFGIVMELVHYRWMSEQVALFLKCEQSKLSENSIKSIFSEIPDAILVTSYSQPKQVSFYNKKFIQLLRIFIKQQGVNYTKQFSEKMLTDCIFVPFEAHQSMRNDLAQ